MGIFRKKREAKPEGDVPGDETPHEPDSVNAPVVKKVPAVGDASASDVKGANTPQGKAESAQEKRPETTEGKHPEAKESPWPDGEPSDADKIAKEEDEKVEEIFGELDELDGPPSCGVASDDDDVLEKDGKKELTIEQQIMQKEMEAESGESLDVEREIMDEAIQKREAEDAEPEIPEIPLELSEKDIVEEIYEETGPEPKGPDAGEVEVFLNQLAERQENAQYFKTDTALCETLVQEARILLDEGLVADAHRKAESAQVALNGELADVVMRGLIEVREMLEIAKKSGANTEKSEKLINKVTFARQDGEVERSLFYMKLAREELEDATAQHSRMSQAIKAAENKLHTMLEAGSDELIHRDAVLEQAKMSLEMADYDDCMKLLKESLTGIGESPEKQEEYETLSDWYKEEETLTTAINGFFGAGEKKQSKKKAVIMDGPAKGRGKPVEVDGLAKGKSDSETEAKKKRGKKKEACPDCYGPLSRDGKCARCEDDRQEKVILEFVKIPSVGYARAIDLYGAGFSSLDELKKASLDELVRIKSIDRIVAEKIGKYLVGD